MPRQPFLPNYEDASYGIGPLVIKDMPKLAQLVGECAAVWSGADFNFSLIIGSLLGVESDGSIAIFNTLRQARNRRDVLEAAARAALSEQDDLELFLGLLHLHASLDGERNAVVHGIWGKCEQIEDGAIWESVESHAVANMMVFRKTLKDESYENHELSSGFYVHRWSDLEDLNRRIAEFVGLTQAFLVYLRYPKNPLGVERRHRLENSPQIQEALATLRNKAGK